MEDRGLTVLTIGGDPGCAELLGGHLAAIAGLQATLTHTASAREGLARLGTDDVDVIFLDSRLGSEDGLNVLERLRARGDLRPVVVLAGRGDEYVAAELTRAGADECVVRSDLGTECLRRCLELALARYRQRTTAAELERARKQGTPRAAEPDVELARAGRLDSLTGVMKRAAWSELAATEHERSLPLRSHL